MKLRKLLGFLMTSSLGLLIAPTLLSQQPPSGQPANQTEKPKPKRPKVWTNEDVAQLRTAPDIYLDEKLAAEESARLAQEAAVKAPAGPPANQEKPAANDFVPPKNVKEAEIRIAEKREEIRNHQELIQGKLSELLKTSDDSVSGALKKETDLLTNELNRAANELKLLEAKLQELRSKQ